MTRAARLMTAARRRTLALLACACALPPGSAQAAATATTTTWRPPSIEQDGGRAFDFAWDIRKQRGGVVDHFNAANAGARCTDCRATAIAFQIVLVSGAPSTVAPDATTPSRSTTSARAAPSSPRRGSSSASSTQPVKLTDAGPRACSPTCATTCGRSRRRTRRSPSCTQAVEQQEARVREVLSTELVLEVRPRRTRPTCSTRGSRRTRTLG